MNLSTEKKANKLKEKMITLGTSNLVNSASFIVFHEVPIPAELKEMRMKLLNSNTNNN